VDIVWHLGILKVLLLKGFVPTIKLVPIAMVLALLVGVVGGSLRVLRLPVLHQLLGAYVYVMRGVPTILLMFICYFVLPTGRYPFAAAVLALVLSNGAYMTEIVRGGLEAIDKGQHEAAKAVAMNFWQSVRYIILPQAVLLVLPALVGQLVLLVKVTALASVIGYVELTKMALNLTGATMAPLPIFFYSGLLYFVVCHLLKMLADWCETAVKDRIIGTTPVHGAA
jgi:His/Glu/Gln/Arg/opine family amino acid ABC transporter permease subunit